MTMNSEYRLSRSLSLKCSKNSLHEFFTWSTMCVPEEKMTGVESEPPSVIMKLVSALLSHVYCFAFGSVKLFVVTVTLSATR